MSRSRPRPTPGRRPRLLLAITLAEVGGAQTFVATLLPALVERYDVVVAAHGPGPVREAAEAAGVRYVPLRHVRRAVGPRDLLGLVELVRLFRRERPDLVHLNSSKVGILGRLAAVLARVPARVFTVHGWAFGAASGRAAALYRLADRAVEPLATRIVCVSEGDRTAGLAARTCRPERTAVIPNGTDLSRPPRPPGPGRPPELLCVGRLAPPKDFRTLLRAAAELEPGSFVLSIAGDGPLRAELEAEAAELGVAGAVRFLGERRDVAALLDAADVFVLSSASEGLPVSVLEAMAAGRPVVASAVGGIPELVVDGETGLLAAPGDAGALARALAALLADAALRERLGRAGRARAEERFGLERTRAAYVALYEELLAGPRPSASSS